MEIRVALRPYNHRTELGLMEATMLFHTTSRLAGHLTTILVAVVLCGFSSHARADACTQPLDLDGFVEKIKQGMAARNEFLADVRRCAAGNKAVQERYDTIAIVFLRSAHNAKSEEVRASLIRYCADLLWALASTGYAPSQHNLAVLHNGSPNAFENTVIRQDQRLFLYYTRQAAAGGYWPSVINLGFRLSRGVPEANLEPQPELAFRIFDSFDKLDPSVKNELSGLLPAIQSDILMMQLSVFAAPDAAGATAKPIPTQYEKNIFLSRVVNAAMQTGLTAREGIQVIDGTTELVNKIMTRARSAVLAPTQRPSQ